MSEGARLCGPDCCYPDRYHRQPEPDWIGDCPIMHGESDHYVPGTTKHRPEDPWVSSESYCLCGHPGYLTCQRYLEDDTLSGMWIQAAESAETDDV